MVENLNFLVAPLLLAGFGLPFGFASGMAREKPEVRFAMTFMAGSVIFTIWATLLSVAGITWSAASVVLPLGATSFGCAWFLSSRDRSRGDGEPRTGWDALAIAIAVAASAHLVASALTARSTSIDFFYFWGVKGIEFARAGGIDAAYLSSPWSGHSHTTYPPLVPLVNAWGYQLADALPWRAALVSSAIWIVMAFPVVIRGLRSRLPSGEATIASCVWLLGVSLAVTSSNSVGNAEPPLVFFATIALVVVVAREGIFPAWVGPLAVSGVVLTKVEGVILWILLVVGIALRSLLERTTPIDLMKRLSGMVLLPAFALGTWIAFELRHGLPLTDGARESVGVVRLENLVPAVVESIRYLEAGSGWFAWGISILVLALAWRTWRKVLPALSVASGTLIFLIIYYLHYQGDSLGTWVRWTLPRVSLPALSAVLLAAAAASGLVGTTLGRTEAGTEKGTENIGVHRRI